MLHSLKKKKKTFSLRFIYVCVPMHEQVCMPLCPRGSQRTICGNHFVIWILGIEPRLSVWVADAFTHG